MTHRVFQAKFMTIHPLTCVNQRIRHRFGRGVSAPVSPAAGLARRVHRPGWAGLRFPPRSRRWEHRAAAPCRSGCAKSGLRRPVGRGSSVTVKLLRRRRCGCHATVGSMLFGPGRHHRISRRCARRRGCRSRRPRWWQSRCCGPSQPITARAAIRRSPGTGSRRSWAVRPRRSAARGRCSARPGGRSRRRVGMAPARATRPVIGRQSGTW